MRVVPLLESTIKLLKRATDKGISLREIAPEGGPVEYEWLKKFYQEKIDDPSVRRIQALHDRLSTMDLEAA
jgi:hypothetical protein